MTFILSEKGNLENLLLAEKNCRRVGMHSFHRYYGKLIPAIPSTFIDKYTVASDLIFDPFCGSGTTAVEAIRKNRHFVGIEINPLAYKIAKTKTEKLDKSMLKIFNSEISQLIRNSESQFTSLDMPNLLNRDHWFKTEVQNDLLAINKVINDYFNAKNTEELPSIENYRNFYLVSLSAIIRNVSNADTRHVFPGISKRMRKLEEDGKIHIDTVASFNRAINKRSDYYEVYENTYSRANILLGDSTTIDLTKYENSVDLVITNPPYISSVRYIETMKLEMYWMKEINTTSDYNLLSKKMLGNDRLRKNEYVEVEYTKYAEINEVIDNMLIVDRKSAKIIGEFFNKIEKVIIQMNFVLKPNKKAVIKISDSKIKKTKIETGKLMTLIAENNGFKFVDAFLDKIDDNSRSLTTSRNSYSDIITHDYIIIWEKI